MEAAGPRAELLSQLDGCAKEVLFANARLCRHAAGETIFRAGDPPDDIFVVQRGRVRAEVEVGGRTLIHAELGPGEFFGEMSVFVEQPRSSTVRAIEDSETLAIPGQVIRGLDKVAPEAVAPVWRMLFLAAVTRLRRGNARVVDQFRERLEQLEREAREKEFMQLLAHDLRSPLAIVEGGLGQLLDRREKYGSLAPIQEQILKRSRRSAVFLRQLLEEILEVGRSERGVSREEAATLADVLLEAVQQSLARIDGPSLDGVDDRSYDAVRAALGRQGLALPGDAALVRAPFLVDRMRLVQIVMNLVGNALKYAPGAVEVRARRDGARLEVEVVDRGAGIPEAFRAVVGSPGTELEFAL